MQKEFELTSVGVSVLYIDFDAAACFKPQSCCILHMTSVIKNANSQRWKDALLQVLILLYLTNAYVFLDQWKKLHVLRGCVYEYSSKVYSNMDLLLLYFLFLITVIELKGGAII